MLVYFNEFKFLIDNYKNVVNNLIGFSKKKNSKIILPCSLNDFALSKNNFLYKSVDLCVSDSMLLTWWFNFKYRHVSTARAYGPDLFGSLLKYLNNSNNKLKVSFLVSSKITCEVFKDKIKKKYPDINSHFYFLLGFSKSKEHSILDEIILLNPRVIFLGIGSPKQIELAVYLKKRLKNCTIFCVGAAFDFFSDRKKQAPVWIRKSGLEWFFRLVTEPRRLWKRYLVIIPGYLFSLLFKKIFKNNL
jgi:N-acetylglucosaminyldiphosphoundecaprenol N-acetyl-beta-D-mannosaminyltransferase